MKICSGCRVEKPLSEFWVDRRRGQAKSRCKACTSLATKEWRRKKPDYERTRYQRVKVETRERHLIRKYKVSLADYRRMLVAQEGKCAICGAPEHEQHNGVFHVDHCHNTGRVRGLLCRGCNHILGHVRDDATVLARAIGYLGAPIVPQVAAEFVCAAREVMSNDR